MEKNRLLSTTQGLSSPLRTALTHTKTADCPIKDYTRHHVKNDLAVFHSQSRASIKSSHTPSERTSPYTENFFTNLAKTIMCTFPLQEFAKENGCEVKDVVRAINVTVVEPLSKPSYKKSSGRPTTAKTTQAKPAESANDNLKAVSMNSTPATLTSFKLPDTRRGAKRRKTMAPVERQLWKQDPYRSYVAAKPKKDANRHLED
ncbi:hypothetical protein BDW62DRAFT_179043 [Aspergillus aurantiobrunneus]